MFSSILADFFPPLAGKTCSFFLSIEEYSLKEQEGLIGDFSSKDGVRLQLEAGSLYIHGLKECSMWIRRKR